MKKKTKKKPVRSIRAAFARINFALPRVFVIEVDVWKCQIAVGISVTGKQFCNTLESRGARPDFIAELRERIEPVGDKYITDRHVGGFFKLCTGYAVMMSADNKTPITNIGTLVHEMAHVAQFLLRDRGVPLSVDNDETFAYLHESLVCKALCHIAFDEA